MAASEQARRLMRAHKRIVDEFESGDWLKVGLLTGHENLVSNHDRLLRSLSWGDPDYDGAALHVLQRIVSDDADNLTIIEDYLDDTLGVAASLAAEGAKRIAVSPTVFQIPDDPVDPNLVSAMMPFASQFDGVYDAIQSAASRNGMTFKRADDIWEHSTIIQDVFSLIYRSGIVVCDFSGKNANVFYETGIAHTLGKAVIPIAQHETDLPFDLRHHRTITYLNNREGLADLSVKLSDRIQFLRRKAGAN